MSPSNSVPRILQQQPGDPEQEPSNSNESQPKPEGQQDEQEMGEGSYEGTREYNRRTKEYLKKADVEADAQAAARAETGRGRGPLAFQGRALSRG